MNNGDELCDLLASFVNRVSHPRGRALSFLAREGLTVDQAILLNYAKLRPGSTPSALAESMNLSLPSASQMLDRLHRMGMVARSEDPTDRRRKTIDVTAKAATFLEAFHDVRCEEFLVGTAPLSATTRQALSIVIKTALDEFAEAEQIGSETKENTP